MEKVVSFVNKARLTLLTDRFCFMKVSPLTDNFFCYFNVCVSRFCLTTLRKLHLFVLAFCHRACLREQLTCTVTGEWLRFRCKQYIPGYFICLHFSLKFNNRSILLKLYHKKAKYIKRKTCIYWLLYPILFKMIFEVGGKNFSDISSADDILTSVAPMLQKRFSSVRCLWKWKFLL